MFAVSGQLLLAQLLLAADEFDRAEALFSGLDDSRLPSPPDSA